MGLVISAQCHCLFCAVLLGFFLGMVYEAWRFLRTAFPHGALLVGIEDFFYCLTCTFCIILLCYACEGGTVRWYALTGTFLGGVIYFFSLGILMRKVHRITVKFIQRLLRAINTRVLSPVFRRISALFRTIMTHLARLHRKRKARRGEHIDRAVRSAILQTAKRGI